MRRYFYGKSRRLGILPEGAFWEKGGSFGDEDGDRVG